MNLKSLLRKKRFWVTLAGAVTAAGYFAAGDISGGAKVLGSIILGQ